MRPLPLTPAQFTLTILLLLFGPTFAHSYAITLTPDRNITLHMDETVSIQYVITANGDESPEDFSSDLVIANAEIATLGNDAKSTIRLAYPEGSFNVTGVFLGRTEAVCSGGQLECTLDVTVVRKKRLIDTLFTSSVATLVAIIYINFGCALNWQDVIKNLKRPVGPVIGFLTQFIIMPLSSYALGKLLFPASPSMQLGMFFTGVSPGGGASNIWALVLDGNVDLSITMTTISTLAAFGMMPLWLFTLGKTIFEQGDISVPYSHITTYALALVVPLAIGYLISRYLKRVGRFMVRILKGFSAMLLLFIIVFAIVANLYLFKLFSWQIVVAGMALPYSGFLLAWIVAKLFRQPGPDCLAIAIETGIQNTGIAIFLLRFTLPQPEGDLTTIVPVSVATMTPIPLLLLWLYKKLRARIWGGSKKRDSVKDATPLNTDINAQKAESSAGSIT